MPSLSEVAVEIAVSQLGVHEQGGNNRGEQVETYLASVRLPPGEPWCAAGMFWTFEQAAKRLGLVNPCPRVGSAAKLWRLGEPICRDSNPSPGAVYVLQHDPVKQTGHTGIIESVNDDGTVTEISFNTNAAGSREGNCVARHTGTSPEAIHGGVLLGYLQFDRAAQSGPSLTV